MSSKAWIKGGKLLINSSGHVRLCDTNPCDSACYADLIEAIRERETVLFGAPTWTTAHTPPYSLSECKAKVNTLASSFVRWPYSGGADAPETYSGSYADGAADYCELYDLIKEIRTTQHALDGGVFAKDSRQYWGALASGSGTWASLKTSAEAAFAFNSDHVVVYSRTLPQAVSTLSLYSSKAAVLSVQEAKFSVTPVYTVIDRAARVFIRPNAPIITGYDGTQVYDAFGLHWIAENEWGLATECESGDWEDWTADWWLADDPPGIPEWPDEPSANTMNHRGWCVEADTDVFVLLDWALVHV